MSELLANSAPVNFEEIRGKVMLGKCFPSPKAYLTATDPVNKDLYFNFDDFVKPMTAFLASYQFQDSRGPAFPPNNFVYFRLATDENGLRNIPEADLIGQLRDQNKPLVDLNEGEYSLVPKEGETLVLKSYFRDFENKAKRLFAPYTKNQATPIGEHSFYRNGNFIVQHIVYSPGFSVYVNSKDGKSRRPVELYTTGICYFYELLATLR